MLDAMRPCSLQAIIQQQLTLPFTVRRTHVDVPINKPCRRRQAEAASAGVEASSQLTKPQSLLQLVQFVLHRHYPRSRHLQRGARKRHRRSAERNTTASDMKMGAQLNGELTGRESLY